MSRFLQYHTLTNGYTYSVNDLISLIKMLNSPYFAELNNLATERYIKFNDFVKITKSYIFALTFSGD